MFCMYRSFWAGRRDCKLRFDEVNNYSVLYFFFSGLCYLVLLGSTYVTINIWVFNFYFWIIKTHYSCIRIIHRKLPIAHRRPSTRTSRRLVVACDERSTLTSRSTQLTLGLSTLACISLFHYPQRESYHWFNKICLARDSLGLISRYSSYSSTFTYLFSKCFRRMKLKFGYSICGETLFRYISTT